MKLQNKKNSIQKLVAPATVLGSTLIVFLALVLTVIAVLFPLATIWALNTLFLLNISYTFLNWLAVIVLLLTIQGALNIRNNR